MSYKVQTEGPVNLTAAINRYVNGVYVGQFPGPFTRQYDYKYTAGERVTGYFKMVKRGELIPMTNFAQWEIHGQCKPAICAITQNGNPATFTEWRGSDGGPVPAPEGTWLVSVAELNAKIGSYQGQTSYFVQAAAAKIYSAGFDSLTFIAELHQTVALFRGLCSRVLNAVRQMKVQDLWLEGRYGWRQIWLDMNSIMDAWRNIDDDRTRRKEKAGQTIRESEVTTSSDNSDGNRTFTRLDTISWEIGLRGNVVADIVVPKQLLNPVTTAWELLRLSFVIDWLVNVGQALEAMSFLVLESQYTACSGVYVKATRHTEFTLGAFKNGWAGTYDRGGGDSVGYMCMRTPQSVSSIPQLKLRLNEFKVLDLVSLIVQAATRRK